MILKPDRVIDPLETIAFLVEKDAIRNITMLYIYVTASFALVVLVQTLYERLRFNSPKMMKTTTVFGFFWAGMNLIISMDTVSNLYNKDPSQAFTVWAAATIIFSGLGGGVEMVGGFWTLFISWAALRARVFPKALNYLGLVVGAAGIVTIVPIFEALTIVFVWGQIPWFICLGLIFLRSKPNK